MFSCNRHSDLKSPKVICDHAQRYGGLVVSGVGHPIPYEECVTVFRQAQALLDDPQVKSNPNARAYEEFLEIQGNLLMLAKTPDQFRCLMDVQTQTDLNRCTAQL